MTRSKFFLKDGLLQGFTLDGHSGAGEAGTDIICAAVPSAAYLIANTLTEVMGCQASAADADGHMAVFVQDVDLVRCQDLLQGFRLHMEGLREQYPRNISVEIAEGTSPSYRSRTD